MTRSESGQWPMPGYMVRDLEGKMLQDWRKGGLCRLMWMYTKCMGMSTKCKYFTIKA